MAMRDGVGWIRIGRAVSLVAVVVVCGAASGNGCDVTAPTCQNTGTCQQPFCSEGHGRYLATADVVIDHDHARRLWQRGFGPAGVQSIATAYCASLVLDGIGGWRVPSSTELASIVFRPGGLGGPDACRPSIDQAAFRSPPGEGSSFWTATVTPDGQMMRLYGDFSDGRIKRDYDDDPTVFVRCVHDPLTP
jgi:hypothetical protein